MLTRAEKVIGSISVAAFGMATLALIRRSSEQKMLREVEQRLIDLKTAYRFAEIVHNYSQSKNEGKET